MKSNTMRFFLISSLSCFSLPLFAAEAVSVKQHHIFNNALFWVLLGIIVLLLVFIVALSAVIKNLVTGSKEHAKEISYKGPKSIIGMLLLIIFSTPAIATEAAPVSESIFKGFISGLDVRIFWMMIAAIIIEAFVLLFLVGILRSLLKTLGFVKETETDESFLSFDKLNAALTDAVPVDREAEIMTDHEYDGIRELDNNLPPWWKYGFYLTIVVSIIYIFNYHIVRSGDLQSAEYNKEIMAAKAAKEEFLKKSAANVNENSVTVLTGAPEIEHGKTLYMEKCVACHGKSGEGNVGPNLTDDYWLHGGGIKNIFKSIKYGIPQKGMIAWEGQLKPNEIQEVSSFILTLKGTNPAGAKAPQGDLYKEEDALPATATDSTASLPDSLASGVNKEAKQ